MGIPIFCLHLVGTCSKLVPRALHCPWFTPFTSQPPAALPERASPGLPLPRERCRCTSVFSHLADRRGGRMKRRPELESALRRFEKVCVEGGSPRLEEYAREAVSVHELCELARADLEWAWRLGQP